MGQTFSTARLYDEKMVRAYISSNRLDPTPPAGAPDAVTKDGSTLIIDTYSWGKVFYAESQTLDSGATWIERNGVRPSLPPWLDDLRTLVDRPECLGFHEHGNAECDAHTDADGVHRPACRWRVVCMEVQRRERDPAKVQHFADQRTDEELWAMVENKPKQQKAERDKARRMTAEEREALRDSNRAASKALAQKMFEKMCELGGWEIAGARWRATEGQYFTVEHQDNYYEDGRINVVIKRRRPQSWTGELKVDVGTEQTIASLSCWCRDVAVTVEIQTNDPEIITSVIGNDLEVSVQERAYKGTQYVQRNVVIQHATEEHVNVVAAILVAVIEGGWLNTYGRGATDEARPGFGIGAWRTGKNFKDPTRWRQKRDEFLQHLRDQGWVPRNQR
jgi:hypothetical protein